MHQKLRSDFCLVIDYDKDEKTPSRIFKGMAELIETFEDIDKYLIETLNSKWFTSDSY